MKMKRRDFLKGAAGSLALLTLDGKVVDARSVEALPPHALGILYDSTLCVGCNACMAACKEANQMVPEASNGQKLWDNPRDLSAQTLNIIKKYSSGSGIHKDQDQDGYAFIKRQCLHCVDPSCVTACPVSALTKDKETGIVGYNRDACIGCRYCQVACPYNIPKFEWDDPYPEIVKCQLCSHLVAKGGISACCSVCPTGASLFGPVAELLEETRRRLQMKPGRQYDFPVSSIDSGKSHRFKAPRYIRQVYGREELGGTQVMYMSAVPFERFGLPSFPKESFVSMASGIQYAIYKGMVYPLVVLAGLVFMVKKNKNSEEADENTPPTDQGAHHE
ncbi:hydrogenase 2 operon protein HybA [Desulfogranum mediterraneum]|uniref:hydrogenase 2 operon protein HybA n=1 Tax=Desulfogranum mediterraneum TaxID=160661 RepID=UPI000419D8FC|nr:hydrogenase 2 operon protein HybA [Desulfogranum mediterraneum]